jgi:hypothetical protein
MDKAELQDVTPVLYALDLARTITFFEQKLGFKLAFGDSSDGYAGVVRDTVYIHLTGCADPEMAANTTCYIYVKNIAPLYEEYKAKGVIHANGALDRTPYGVDEFVVLGIDGNEIRFGEVIAQN